MMEYYVCPDCGGRCKESKLTKNKRICVKCNEMFDLQEVTIESYAKKNWERTMTSERLEQVKEYFEEIGLGPGQIKQILVSDRGVTEQELVLMIDYGWGLARIRA